MKEFDCINETGWNFNNSYIKLPEFFYSIIKLNPVSSPQLVVLNESLAKKLGLNIEKIKSRESIEVFAGNRIPKGGIAIAQAYAGHQFGYFTMLGDGRAMLLGEHITPKSERFDIQLKGSGRTPYSRGGDGRATLGPMLREYIISEAMYGLKIPTTRSLAVVTTGESIIRESILKGAVLTRISSSHIRVGTFEYAKRFGTKDDLKVLADYTIKRHFPNSESSDNRYLFLLKEVIKKQADLISKWMLVGFVHGVMNTDNMTISGETIDYGPCAFMDYYDPNTVFSSIDVYGRYAYGKQPTIAAWNLARFAETLLPLLHENEDEAVKLAQYEIEKFYKLFKDNWLNGMRSKIGLFNEDKVDEMLINNLLNLMHKYNADYTNTFVALTFDKLSNNNLFNSLDFKKWYELWKKRLYNQNESKEKVHHLMKNSNPAIIPRNHRVEEALEAAVKHEDFTVMKKLLDVLKNPYEHSDKQCEYAKLSSSKEPYKTYCGT